MSFEMSSFSLSGRTALIIGGAGGIGREIALGFRNAGARVLIAGRSQDKLDRGAAELGAGSGQRIGYAVDVRSVDALSTFRDAVQSDHGPLHILVNCQGVTEIKPALDLTEAEYDAILDTNVKSVFFACTIFGSDMIDRKQGAIINISSLAAHTGWANAAAYSVSKWGVAALTQTLAAEWGETGVRVNAIAPGFFMTELNQAKMPEARKAEARKRAAMKRMGELNELVGAAIFLASDAARFITGSTLRVDGGYLASGI
jgi:NAD(P)-dependent dehydrogenase (short-subunit alcohol dehydrogenase family)